MNSNKMSDFYRTKRIFKIMGDNIVDSNVMHTKTSTIMNYIEYV